eukprot:CAMPEP_0114671836 /NCGR_PEP_ID=MMETSP0191-20121206/41845_1 /TAXON_ID=126664 /ORGANISM="Sorites sp." /LENGTH=58 /DNA_ID=CAMNT_0001932655 /DNA_START=494 /DNA_END=670 /DNA_ORIENTATION=-
MVYDYVVSYFDVTLVNVDQLVVVVDVVDVVNVEHENVDQLVVVDVVVVVVYKQYLYVY